MSVDEGTVSKSEYDRLLNYAQLQSQRIRDLNSSSSDSTKSFTNYTRENILEYLKSPRTNEKRIRDISIKMYHSSTHYKRLILHYGLMPTWSYILSPVGFDSQPSNKDSFAKSYHKAAALVESMNLKHEMQKALIIGLREGIFYGAIWQNKSSFFIQSIDPDICDVTSIEDGTWLYSVNMSKIKENELDRYPPEFTQMWNDYKATKKKWQLVPPEIAFCFKADETTSAYSLPPWASSMAMLLDIENYKLLQETATEIANYKLLHMRIPVNSDDTPKFTFDQAHVYYDLLYRELPPFIGVSMAPMEITNYDFERSGGLKDVDVVARAERQFWTDSGSSSLLFGDAANNTAGALKLSIKSDEELIFGWMNQLERVVNRFLKTMPGTQKFKITFLPVTEYNKSEMIGYYKEAATLGIPTKSALASALGVHTTDVTGMDYIEREMLHMDELSPLSSSYNTPAGEAGRPPLPEEDLTESGTNTRNGGDGSDG